MVRESAFQDVRDSQVTFRALLDVMSRPGTVRQLPACDYRAAPRGFCAPALTVLKTLCDHRVSFSLGSETRRDELVRYLEVNLTAPFRSVSEADYVLFEGASFDEDFRRLNVGTPEFPEASATALLCVSDLAPGETEQGGRPSCTLVLAGPGVPDRSILSVCGLDPRYGEERRGSHRRYPQGVDLLLVDRAGRVAAIPRSSRVETA